MRTFTILTRVHSVKTKAQECKQIHCIFCHLRYTRIAAVLFLPEPILLHEEVKALRLFPHVVKSHTFCYSSRCDLRKRNYSKRGEKLSELSMCTVCSHIMK